MDATTPSEAHTAGPWEAVGNFVRTARRPEDMSGLGICECLLTDPNYMANARLIAAAPAMLEALRDILSIAAEFIDEESDARAYRLDAARDAIAKATGDKS